MKIPSWETDDRNTRWKDQLRGLIFRKSDENIFWETDDPNTRWKDQLRGLIFGKSGENTILGN
jgi:hypothetical protein